MKMRYGHIAGRSLLLAAWLLACGCVDLISVTSEPAGAKVWIDGIYRGTTPLLTHVEWRATRKNTVVLKKDGYAPIQGYLNKVWMGDRLSDDVYMIPLLGVGLFAPFFNGRGPATLQHFTLEKTANP